MSTAVRRHRTRWRRSPTWEVVVRSDGAMVEVVAGRSRSALRSPDRAGLPAAAPGPGRSPASVAWPAASADRAARQRWADRHHLVAVIRAIDPSTGTTGEALAALVGAAVTALGDEGFRRVDVRLAPDHPLAPTFTRPPWTVGHVDGDLVASRALGHPWRTPPPDRPSRLPDTEPVRLLRRTVRRLAHLRPRGLPDLVATQVEEARERVRARRRRPPAVEAAPLAAGYHPHAETRFRTIRRALDLVPDALADTTFLDVGSGAGRVLEVASARHRGPVVGIELDAGLARRSRELLGERATIVEADALVEPIGPDVGVVFLNNPFDGPTSARFTEHLRRSLRARPRPLLVLHLNPPALGPWIDAGFEVAHVDPGFSVLVSPS